MVHPPYEAVPRLLAFPGLSPAAPSPAAPSPAAPQDWSHQPHLVDFAHSAGAVSRLVPGLVDRLEGGIDVADVGCGSGHALNLMAEAFPRSRFSGFDLSETGLAAASAEADRKALTNVRFEKRDAASLGETARFDLITTFDSVHDQARPDLMLAGIARALRPDGVYLCAEVRASSELAENMDHRLGPFLYTISCMHCMTVSLAENGMGLGAMWGEQKAREMLRDAGFTSMQTAHIPGDDTGVYFIATHN